MIFKVIDQDGNREIKDIDVSYIAYNEKEELYTVIVKGGYFSMKAKYIEPLNLTEAGREIHRFLVMCLD